jgi:membrane associated rhomboid family serine protease
MLIPLGDDVDHREFSVLGVILIAVNVAIFAYMVRIFCEQQDLAVVKKFVDDWGLVPADLTKGKWYGLITYMFLHGSLFHLLGNMLCFWAFVNTLENSYGIVRFALFYLLWGVLAGLAQAAMHWGSPIPIIGASGAIAGMMGAYYVKFGLYTKIKTLVFIIYPFIVNIPAYVFTAIWVLIQLFSAASTYGLTTGVAWYAHLGGFLAGALTAVLCGENVKARLVLNKSGMLELQSTAQLQEADQTPVTQLEAPPPACPFCHTELSEKNRIAANLMRCPNPSCARCIYLDEILVEN